MPPKQAVIKTKKQDTQQNPVTTTVPMQSTMPPAQNMMFPGPDVRVQYQAPSPSDAPIQRKAEDYYTDSAQQIADYFKSAHEQVYISFSGDLEIRCKFFVLKILKQLEPKIKTYHGTPFETYKQEFEQEFQRNCREQCNGSPLSDLAQKRYGSADGKKLIADLWENMSSPVSQDHAESAQKEPGQQASPYDDYLQHIRRQISDFFSPKLDLNVKQFVLNFLPGLEPFTTECEWAGMPFETYRLLFSAILYDTCFRYLNSFASSERARTSSNTNYVLNLIHGFLKAIGPSSANGSVYPKSAKQVYGYSYNNKYEEHRVKAKGETESPAMKKLFLRRLNPKNNMDRRDDIIDRKLRESRTEPLLNEEYPRLKMSMAAWSPIVNDAFVGGGIDAGARFKISDLSDDTMKEIANISQQGAGDKLEQFWKICKTDLNLYDEKAVTMNGYGYTVLAREIALLLKKGWIFKTFPRKEGPKEYYKNNNLNLIAFKDEAAVTAYIERKDEVRQNRASAQDHAPAGT